MEKLGILFDYNGVLANDEHLHEEGFREVLSQFGVDLTAEFYKEYCLGRTDADGFEALKVRLGEQLAGLATQELVAMKQSAYQQRMVPEEILYPGVVGVLSGLNGSCPYAIVTSSKRCEVMPVVEYLGQYDIRFRTLVTADDITRGKPDPEGYLKGLCAIELPHEQVVAVEDSPSGVKAAKAAGLVCVAVCHTTPNDRLREADMIVPNIRNITPWLLRSVIG